MDLIPAPGRQLKTYSFWLLALLAFFDLANVLVAYYGEQHLLPAHAVYTINAVVAFLALLVRQFQQQIAVTPEQKAALIEAAEAAPLKPTKGTP